MEDIPADSVIFAIGQTSDLSFLDPADGVESERGLIKVNRETYQTTAPDVFACGDIAHGAAPVHRRHRLGADRRPLDARFPARHPHRGGGAQAVEPATYTMAESWNVLRARRNPPVLESERRAASLEIVEEAIPKRTPGARPSRCLRCNVNTVFDTAICVACNGCVDVCPENLIRLVGLSELMEDRRGWPRAARGIRNRRSRLRAHRARRTRRDGRRHDEGRDHLHPLRHVRLALPDPRHPDEALRFLPGVRHRAAPNPKVLYQMKWR